MVIWLLVFWGTSILFSIVAALMYIPTNSVEGFSFLSPPLQHLLPVDFLTTAILTGLRWYFIVALMCISFLINDIEHIFMCLLTVWISSLERCLFRSSPHFSTGLFVLLFLLSCMSKPQFKTSSLQKAMAPHSSTLAWKIPWMEQPGRLQSMGSLRVRHYWATSLSFFTFMHWRRKWQSTPVFLPGESQGRGRLEGRRLWGRTKSDTTETT